MLSMKEAIENYVEGCVGKVDCPAYCAKVGMVDEIVDMTDIRPYIQAFTEAAYQNPKSICPMHQMVTPRAIREWNDAHKA